MTTEAEPREELLKAADEARAKLVGTIVRIDERRREVFDIRYQVRRYLRRFPVVEAFVAVTLGVAVVVATRRFSTRADRRRAERWRLAKRMWWHPDRELRAERAPFAVEVGRSLLLTVVTSAMAIPLRKAIRQSAGAGE